MFAQYFIEALVDWRLKRKKGKRFELNCDTSSFWSDISLKNHQFKICQDPLLWVNIFIILRNKCLMKMTYRCWTELLEVSDTLRYAVMWTTIHFTRSWCIFELANLNAKTGNPEDKVMFGNFIILHLRSMQNLNEI